MFCSTGRAGRGAHRGCSLRRHGLSRRVAAITKPVNNYEWPCPGDLLPRLPRASRDTLRNVVARACKAAGIPHFSLHDLWHRYASIKVAEGVPVTNLAEQLGHTNKSLTLDTYSHVLLAD